MSDESDNNAYEASKDFQREKKNDNILRTTLKDSSFTKTDKKKFIEAAKQFSNFLKNGTKELSISKKESHDYNKSLPINNNEKQKNGTNLNTTEVRKENRLIKAVNRRQLTMEEKEIIKNLDTNARRIARDNLNESEQRNIKGRDLSNLRRKRECMDEKKRDALRQEDTSNRRNAREELDDFEKDALRQEDTSNRRNAREELDDFEKDALRQEDTSNRRNAR
jgi:hypothetical protein